MPQDRDDELAREIRTHLELETEEGMDAGLSPEEARFAAVRAFGNVTRVREETRTVWTAVWWENVRQDLRYALGTLSRNPGFVATAVLTLGLGIGANTAIYQLFDALSLRTLPVADPHALVIVDLAERSQLGGRRTSGHPVLTNPLWEEFRKTQQVFSGALAWSNTDLRLDLDNEFYSARGLYVSGEFFQVLGVTPMLGRMLTAADDRPRCEPRAVVSHGFWQRQFGGDPATIGKTIVVNSRPTELVGVTPPGFTGLDIGRTFDIAVPVCAQEAWARGDSRLQNDELWWLTVMGRLPAGGTLDIANAQLAGLSPDLFARTLPARYSTDAASDYLQLRLKGMPGGTGVSSLRSRYGDPLLVLLAATGLVLLIACTNIANLILARTAAREREFAVRLALGGSRGRILRQLMIEYGLVAACGAAMGLAVALTLSQYLAGFLGASVSLGLRLDARLLAFVVGIAVLTCLAFGLIPAWRASGDSAVEAMRASGRSLSASRRAFGLRQTLVVSQLALSVVLLVGALLFAGTLRNLLAVDTGFQAQGVEIVGIDLSRLETPPENRPAVKRQILDRIRSAPGVTAVAEVRHLPLGGTGSSIEVWRDGGEANARDLVRLNAVSPGYLETMGIPLTAGRDFTEMDSNTSPALAIVNPAFVRRLGLVGNPIGQAFYGRGSTSAPATRFEIAGLVPDTKYFTLREDFLPIAFVPIASIDDQRAIGDFVVRATSPVAVPSSPVRRAVSDVNPRIGIDVRAFDQTLSNGLQRERLMAALASSLGVLATTIASIGLYGLVTLLVARRTKEICIRIALGASRIEILVMVFRQAGKLLVLGLGVGSGLALAASGLIRSVVFGVQPYDAGPVALACAVLAGVALAAAYLPARRAARLEPVMALRDE
jgi:putative ABC transport system permease protein